jgi:Holliday junction resolvasome RuvABC endonuclease subunit
MILAIDPGTHCGWAVMRDDDSVDSGTWDLTPRKHESAGMRYVRLVRHLDALNDESVECICYELVSRHAGTTAAHVYGAIVGHLQSWAAQHNTPLAAYPVTVIKKHATGKGNADKAAMIEAARRQWPSQTILDDNQADALAVLGCCVEALPARKGLRS